MGLYLSFYLNCKEVKAKEWERAYYECLDWLKKFPLPLSRLEKVGEGEKSYYAYNLDLVVDKGTKKERWNFEGDEMSGRHSEEFGMPRHLEVLLNKQRFYGVKNEDKSVFFAGKRRPVLFECRACH